jgi:hypothetical protein
VPVGRHHRVPVGRGRAGHRPTPSRRPSRRWRRPGRR